MLNYAFKYVERALFDIGVNNLRSRRAIEKLGAHLTGDPSGDVSRVVYEIRRGAANNQDLLLCGAQL